MSLIDAVVRGGAFFLLILVAALLLRDARRVPAGLFGALFALGVASYVIVSDCFVATQPPGWMLPLRIIGMGNPVVFCLFAAAMFDDDFKPSRWHALAWLAIVAFGMLCLWSGTPLMRYAFSAVGLTCNAIAVWYALAERSLDLVEERRRLRSVLVVVIAFYAAAIIASETLFPNGSGGEGLALAIGAGLLAITVVFAVVLLSVSREGAFISFGQSEPQPLSVTPFRPAVAPSPSERSERDDDTRLLASLRRLMDHDRAYREEGLSIGGLAAKLGTSEHGLRRLINQRLGHRNFNVFLNGYRLDDAMTALADPAQEEVPILTIALDAGFQSLGPFNRAFKSKTGVTPSEFRREQLGRRDRVAAE